MIMAINMVTEIDRNFLNDNFLESEDWAFMSESKMDELPHFLKLDDGFNQYDVQSEFLNGVKEDSWKDLSDGSDSGVDTLSMKPEPLSPSSLSDAKAEPHSPYSLCSDSSYDSVICTVPSNTVTEMDTYVDTATEITQEEWDSLQSVLFEQENSGFGQDGGDTACLSDSSFSISDCEPSFLSSDFASSVASPSSIHTVTISGQTVKCVKGVGLNYQTIVSNGNVGSVLNSKIKIQPKPLSSTQSPVCDKPSTVVSTNRPVITVTLPALNTSQQSRVQLSSVIPSIVNTTSTVLSAPITTLPENSSIDVRALKRHQRMIKNRESACLSRKRKKDYMQSLEQQLYSISSDNDRLKTENLSLKRKVEQLHNENERLKRISVSKATGAGVLLCIFCLLSFNYLPFQFPSHEQSRMLNPAIHTGRSLLSVDSKPNAEEQQTHVQVDTASAGEHRPLMGDSFRRREGLDFLQDVKDLVLSSRREGPSFSNRFLCPTFFNSTESRRLVSELEGWVLSHEEELRRQRELNKRQQVKTKKKKVPTATLR